MCGKNGKKRGETIQEIRERREPSGGVGRGKGMFSQTSARLASLADFFGSFTTTAELGPRLECLTKLLRM